MVQVFIVGDDEGEVTVGGPIEDNGRLFAFEWDIIANGGVFTGDVNDLDEPIVSNWTIVEDPIYGFATLSPDILPSPTVQWTYVLDETNPAVQDLEFGETLTDVFVVQAIGLDDLGRLILGATREITITINGVCFLAGTKIATEAGYVAVEKIAAGQWVKTRNAGYQKVLWTGGQWYAEADWRSDRSLWPVCISAGSLGSNQPANDLYVSQQHRMPVSGRVIEHCFGFTEALVSAKQLCGLEGIEVVEPNGPLGYFHLLCENHQLIDAEGTWAETILLGDEALFSISAAELASLARLFSSWSPNKSQIQFQQPTCLPVLKAFEANVVFGMAEKRMERPRVQKRETPRESPI